MNPDRQAMIFGYKSPTKQQRDITAPRQDPNTRISKRARPSRPNPSSLASNAGHYLSQDEQSKRFVAEEDKFVLKQSKKKADIRVREARAKAIDYLAFNIRYIDNDRDVFDDDDADIEIDVPAPDKVLEGLNEAELKELGTDITSFYTLETSQRNREYWKALQLLCDDRRQKLQPQGHEGRAVSSVASDVDKILGPKSFEQLEALEKQIKAKLQSDEQIDTDYWEQLLKSLLVWKAKAKLKKINDAIKQSRAEQPKERDPEKAQAPEPPQTSDSVAPSKATATSHTMAKAPTTSGSSADSQDLNPPPGTARFASTGSQDFSQATKALYDREVARGIGENEEIFTAEEAVSSSAKPQWADKYRPRKPQYFNRVQMGYEWNKYNQTHYDHDNPPPKVVQGYKFNIFYPDLIDKTKAPTFKIVREGGRRRGESFAPAGEEDTCLLRFIAGPPYEDIAFRIVDREWDYSAKRERGFRSSFDKGILQLHFQFKKIYYRK